MKQVLLLLTKGNEEMEAVSVIDLLRRAKLKTTIAAVLDHQQLVECALGTRIQADTLLSQVDPSSFDALILPGGSEAAQTFTQNQQVQSLIKRMQGEGKLIGAICAGPLALDQAGVLAGKQATCYPGIKLEQVGIQVADKPVVWDGQLITSQGPGTAMAFGLTLIEALLGPEARTAVAKQLLLDRFPVPQ